MEPVSRDDLVFMISYAISRNLDLRPRRRTIMDATILAEAIVKHLEPCGVETTKRPHAPCTRRQGNGARRVRAYALGRPAFVKGYRMPAVARRGRASGRQASDKPRGRKPRGGSRRCWGQAMGIWRLRRIESCGREPGRELGALWDDGFSGVASRPGGDFRLVAACSGGQAGR
jgi:hypothetical protein